MSSNQSPIRILPNDGCPSTWQARLTLYDGMRDFRLVYRRSDDNVD